jgi:hypothetical protein
MPDRDPFQSLWAQQAQEPFAMSLADIHSRAGRFQSRIRTRNLTEYAAAALVIGVFGWMAFLIPDLVVKLGAVLTALGAAYVAYMLHRKGGAGAALPDGAQPCADFHRRELRRQREALATVPRWYLAPFVPGMLVFVGGVSFVADTGMPLMARFFQFGSSAVIICGLFAGVAWLNARAVKQLDTEIAALDAARRGE